jgi:hypothetical protein
MISDGVDLALISAEAQQDAEEIPRARAQRKSPAKTEAELSRGFISQTI